MKALYLSLTILALGACREADSEREPPTARSDSASPSSAESALSSDTSAWVVGPTAVGPLRFGTSLRELLPRLEPGFDTLSIADACEYVDVAGAPDSLGFMVEDRRLVRVDVRDHRTPTVEGARVGDSEARILSLYPQARREPHAYTNGFYLIAVARAPVDTVYRYVFEIDGSRVTTYRAGLYPQVEYVEGCS